MNVDIGEVGEGTFRRTGVQTIVSSFTAVNDKAFMGIEGHQRTIIKCPIVERDLQFYYFFRKL